MTDDLVLYYIGFDAGFDLFFANRQRLWIYEQVPFLDLEDWCFDLDRVGA